MSTVNFWITWKCAGYAFDAPCATEREAIIRAADLRTTPDIKDVTVCREGSFSR